MDSSALNLLAQIWATDTDCGQRLWQNFTKKGEFKLFNFFNAVFDVAYSNVHYNWVPERSPDCNSAYPYEWMFYASNNGTRRGWSTLSDSNWCGFTYHSLLMWVATTYCFLSLVPLLRSSENNSSWRLSLCPRKIIFLDKELHQNFTSIPMVHDC